MAVINRKTWVLTNVCVVRGVVTGTMGSGLNTAGAQPPASLQSSRHPSQRYPLAMHEPRLRHDRAEDIGTASAATRAGRPGCRALASRSPALRAGRIIRLGWSLAIGGAGSPAAWRLDRFMAKRPASVGKAASRRFPASRVKALRAAGRLGRPGFVQAQRLVAAGRTLAASTRG